MMCQTTTSTGTSEAAITTTRATGTTVSELPLPLGSDDDSNKRLRLDNDGSTSAAKTNRDCNSSSSRPVVNVFGGGPTTAAAVVREGLGASELLLVQQNSRLHDCGGGDTREANISAMGEEQLREELRTKMELAAELTKQVQAIQQRLVAAGMGIVGTTAVTPNADAAVMTGVVSRSI